MGCQRGLWSFEGDGEPLGVERLAEPLESAWGGVSGGFGRSTLVVFFNFKSPGAGGCLKTPRETPPEVLGKNDLEHEQLVDGWWKRVT